MCPSCGFIFRFLPSAKFWNPYRVPCPQCGLLLRVQHATRHVIASAVIGLAIAAVAIYYEKTGRWHEADSLRFFAFAIPAALFPWTAFIWYRTKFVPRNDA